MVALAVFYNATIKNAKINSVSETGYGVRASAAGNGNTLNIINCEFEAKVPVLVRKSSDKTYTYNLNLTGVNTLTSTGAYQIIATANDKYTSDSALTKAAGSVKMTGATGMSVYYK